MTTPDPSRHGRGMIAIPAGAMARWSAFWGCLPALELPAGTLMKHIVVSHGSSPASNRNRLVHKALQDGFDWVFFLDDDLIYRSDTLLRLLDRDVDIVMALSFNRATPFKPLWWAEPPDPDTRRVTLMEHTDIQLDGGLQRIAGGTSGAMLVRTRVFKGVASPHWTLGQFVADEWHDDVWFCELARAAGFEIWGDPTVKVGHMAAIEIWPKQDDETGELGVLQVQGPNPVAFWKP